MLSGWLLPIAEGEQRFKFFSSFYTYRSCWSSSEYGWLAQNEIMQKNKTKRNIQTPNSGTTLTRWECALVAFWLLLRIAASTEIRFYLALHLHHPGNQQADTYSEAIVQKLHFSNLTFALRSPLELILVIGEKHRLWFWTVWSRSGLDSVHWQIPLLQMGGPCTDPRLWAHARRNWIGKVRLLSDIIVLLKLNKSLSNRVLCVKYTSTNSTYYATCHSFNMMRCTIIHGTCSSHN